MQARDLWSLARSIETAANNAKDPEKSRALFIAADVVAERAFLEDFNEAKIDYERINVYA